MDEPTLLQSSPYFAGLLGGGFAEQESRVINFGDVDPAALECVCMAIRCGAHPEAAFESFSPTVLTKAIELCVRIQVPDTLVEANAEAIIAKLDDLDVPVALDLLAASELHSVSGAENLRDTWEQLKDTAIHAIACKLEMATDEQISSLSTDHILLVLTDIDDVVLAPVTVASPAVPKEHVDSEMLAFGNLGFGLKVKCEGGSIGAFLYSPRACFVGGTKVSLVARPGSRIATAEGVRRKVRKASKPNVDREFPSDVWIDESTEQGFPDFCADSAINDFLHEDGKLLFSVEIRLAGLERKANLVVKWAGMQEGYQGPDSPCWTLRWLASDSLHLVSSVDASGSSGHDVSTADFSVDMSSMLIEYTASTFFAQKDLNVLPASILVNILEKSLLRTAKSREDESEMRVLCAVLDWTLCNDGEVSLGAADVPVKATDKTAKVLKHPKGKHKALPEDEVEPVLLKKGQLEPVDTMLTMLLEKVRFPYILLSELTAALSAPQWETLNASPKFQELVEQATEFQIKMRSLESPGSGNLGRRHIKRSRQPMNIPTLSANQIFGLIGMPIGQQPLGAPVVSP